MDETPPRRRRPTGQTQQHHPQMMSDSMQRLAIGGNQPPSQQPRNYGQPAFQYQNGGQSLTQQSHGYGQPPRQQPTGRGQQLSNQQHGYIYQTSRNDEQLVIEQPVRRDQYPHRHFQSQNSSQGFFNQGQSKVQQQSRGRRVHQQKHGQSSMQQPPNNRQHTARSTMQPASPQFQRGPSPIMSRPEYTWEDEEEEAARKEACETPDNSNKPSVPFFSPLDNPEQSAIEGYSAWLSKHGVKQDSTWASVAGSMGSSSVQVKTKSSREPRESPPPTASSYVCIPVLYICCLLKTTRG